MSDVENVIDPEIEKRERLKQELIKSFGRYQKVISLMSVDAPISILCLPKNIEKLLSQNGFLRLYEILDMDFTKIEWLTDANRARLTTSLDQFTSML